MSSATAYPNPDKSALVRVGSLVRKRLAADPAVQKVPTSQAEIFAVSQFLSSAECEQLITMIDSVAKPSRVFDHGYGANFRTSYSGDVVRCDPFVQMVERRIDDLLGMQHDNGETIQGQRYLPGQEFKPHMDWFFSKASYWKDEARRGGQRCITAMVYLNDVVEGGTTDFTRIGVSIPPQQGAMVVNILDKKCQAIKSAEERDIEERVGALESAPGKDSEPDPQRMIRLEEDAA